MFDDRRRHPKQRSSVRYDSRVFYLETIRVFHAAGVLSIWGEVGRDGRRS